MAITQRLPMTPGRAAALILGVPIALAIICVTAVSIVAPAADTSIRVDRTLPLQSATAGVTVDNPDMTLSAGAAADRVVHVRGTLTGSFAKPRFDVHTTAAGVAVQSHCVVPIGNCSGTLDVTVPARLPVHASDGNGDLTASGLSGQVTLSDGSGDLSAARLSGTIVLSDDSGEINASDLSGRSIKISESAGDITASGLSGSALSLANSSGDITVTGLQAADVTGNADSGDIMLTFAKVPRLVDVTDSSGDITLVLPPGPASYAVTTQVLSGNAAIRVRRRSSSPQVIYAKADSGDITVRY